MQLTLASKTMAVLFTSHPRFFDHDTGPYHPESQERLMAVNKGIKQAGLEGSLLEVLPRAATWEELTRVHDADYLHRIQDFCSRGGGYLDPDTVVSTHSYEAALFASGAGIDAVERIERGEADEGAFLAVRPPGHHATRNVAMGFCIINNVAVTAASLVAAGKRVLIVDWDAHHGNGTQEAFYDCSQVVYVSFHQHPLYPGTGSVDDIGNGKGRGANVNIPLPPGSSGDAFRLAMDTVVAPLAERFSPEWVLVSAGFDSHRDDPLANLGLTAGDYFDLTEKVAKLAPQRHLIVFLEGGYDLDAVAFSAGACIAALSGVDYRPEPASQGHLGMTEVNKAADRIKVLMDGSDFLGSGS